jgi:hypothetical protein
MENKSMRGVSKLIAAPASAIQEENYEDDEPMGLNSSATFS